ncbi:MAG: T9SS type A sorting domain-containing protein, partial [Bacteroidota bacterium]
AEALRILHKTVNWIPGVPGVEVGHELQFFTLDGNLDASIVLEDERAFYAVSNLEPTQTTSTRSGVGNALNFSLTGIYPNPVINNTKLQFTTEQAGQVALQLRDLQGRMMQQLVRQHYPAGEHQVEWQKPATLPAGIYLLEMQHQGQRSSRLLAVQ